MRALSLDKPCPWSLLILPLPQPTDQLQKNKQTTHRIDSGVRVDLEGVHIVPGVLEQSVDGVEHFVGEQVQPLPGYAAIVQAILSLKLDVEFLLQVSGPDLHDGAVGVFKYILPGHLDAAVARRGLHSIQLRPQGLHLVDQVTPSKRCWGRSYDRMGVLVDCWRRSVGHIAMV